MFFKRLFITIVCLVSFAQVKAAAQRFPESWKPLVRAEVVARQGAPLTNEQKKIINRTINTDFIKLAMRIRVQVLKKPNQRDFFTKELFEQALFMQDLTNGKFGLVALEFVAKSRHSISADDTAPSTQP